MFWDTQSPVFALSAKVSHERSLVGQHEWFTQLLETASAQLRMYSLSWVSL